MALDNDNIRWKQARELNDFACRMLAEEKYAVAEVALHRAMNLDPSFTDAPANLGLLMYRIGRFNDARYHMIEAIKLSPENPIYHGNLGVLASTIGDYELAERELKLAIDLKENNYGAMWDLSLLHLRTKPWGEVLPSYEVRTLLNPDKYPTMPYPIWKGEDLNGKSIFVQGEQGFGDRFLFSRYLWGLKDHYPDCTIYACIYDDLNNLFWEFHDFVTFLPSGIPFPNDIDYGVWLVSLPGIFGNIIDDPGLILKRIENEPCACTLPEPDLQSLKVGFAWTGNATMSRNHDRTIPLPLMLSLAEDPRIQLYSFQVGPGHTDLLQSGAASIVVDLAPDLLKKGWIGTALAMRECDLIITACTSIAHLAGVLKVPTWTLLCADPYWVWGRSGDATPWYPNMKLFRQRKLNEWSPVIERVKTELSSLAYRRLN